MVQIAGLSEKVLLPFAIDRILDNTTTDFDLFINVSEHMVLYGANGYYWGRDELEGLLRNGHTHLLVRREDQSKVKMYEAVSHLPIINRDLAPPDRIVRIEQVAALFVRCLHEGELTPSALEKAKSISDALVECIAEDRHCIRALSGLQDHDQYTYFHSVRVASYAVAIAMQMGLSDRDQVADIAVGGIFHDIGKKTVSTAILNKTGALTESEWRVMRYHPESGYLTLRSSILKHVPLEIILHHHEKLDGSGYPHNLDRNSIITEVQIAGLADVFDALTSSRAYQQKRSRYEALDLMKHRMLGPKLSVEVFQGLVACLAG